jgi:hypothetical protein
MELTDKLRSYSPTNGYAKVMVAAADEIDRLRQDAARYQWLRAGGYSLQMARSVLNDTPHGIDAAVDAAMKAQG